MSLDNIKISGEIITKTGSKPYRHEIFVFGLSTCQWCKQGLRWLKERRYTYSYFFIDNLALKERMAIKEQITSIFNIKIIFPILIIDRFHAYAGFNPNDWELLLA